MKKTTALSKINPTAKRIPALDDYELKPHYDIDYSKAQANPYAGRVKLAHGGARPGAGRKHAPEPIERHMISFYKPHVKLLRALDKNLSRAIRKLITKAR
jgi:hypothetical protein